MYKNELDNHIRKKTVSNSFIFFGENSFLIDLYTKMLTNIEDASILTFYFDEYNFTSAKAHLSQASLFGGQNILIIKSEKKVPKKELEIFIKLCEKNKDNILVFAYYGNDTKTYAKPFPKTKTMCVRFFNPKHFEAQNIILEIAKDKNINISKYTISHLLNTHNGDISLCVNELDKFIVFDREITTKDIDMLVYGLGAINLDDFIKKIIDKKEFSDDLKNLLDHGVDEIRVIIAITSFITQLYMFNIYIRVNGSANALDILGYPAPKFVVDEKAKLSLKFKPTNYYNIHKLLLENELKMKSSNIDKGAILLSTLIRLQRLL